MRPETQSTIAQRPAPHRQYAPGPDSGRDRPGWRAGLYPGEPENCRRRTREFLLIVLHLGLLLAVFKVYNLETRAFRTLVILTLAALPVHYLAAFRWKKPLFIAVSIVGMFWIYGPATSGCVLAVSAVLLGLCAAPLAWGVRAALIAAVAVVLAVLRPSTGPIAEALPPGVIPVLAMIFMFRMIIYLYELKHSKAREPLADTLSYFFLLPNYCFQLFPVVDYRTMQRGYFARSINSLQRTGVLMMSRGTVHLLLYRLIYHELVIRPDEVHNAASLLGYLVCNYLLYLHVSGQFHLACGMLHLFGFQLPETHHHYLLATSFTDYWRRINIYWKDFMVRIVFNPVFFRLKRWPQPAALAAATALVFVATWWLHAYQKFWLTGAWGFSVHDSLFWGILGVLVLVNVQCDARRCRARSLKPTCETPRRIALRAVQVAGTFSTIALLWSLWNSAGVGPWLEMLRRGLSV